jgi:hypothetical protein
MCTHANNTFPQNTPPKIIISFKSSEHEAIEKVSRLPQETKDYVEQLEAMRQNDRTTLYVDFSHIELTNQTLAEAIQTHYFRYVLSARNLVMLTLTKEWIHTCGKPCTTL